jgi:hypothetical protein
MKSLKTKKEKPLIKGWLHVIALAAAFVLLLSFAGQITFAREIVYFNLHKSEFEQIVTEVSDSSKCVATLTSTCSEYIEVESPFANQVLVMTGSAIDGFTVSIFSRKNVSYVYFPNQNKLPQSLNINIYSMNCYYRLNPDWFICGVTI